jgi:AraC family transcriptional regulator
MTVTLMPPLSSNIPTPPCCGPLSPRAMVERVIQAMRDRLDLPWTLEDLAAIAGMSVYHFHRVFRAVTGIPPSEFLTLLRLQEAKRLLLTTSWRVNDICLEVGYTSVGTFTARFSQGVGASPGRLRQFADTASLPTLADLRDVVTADRDAEARPNVAGDITAPSEVRGPIFVGLFPKPIPRARPVAGAVVTAPGPFQICAVPDGRYYLMAAALPWAEDPRVPLLCDTAMLVGVHAGPLTIQGGTCLTGADIGLRSALPTDPPVLSSLPFFLSQRLAGAVGAA